MHFTLLLLGNCSYAHYIAHPMFVSGKWELRSLPEYTTCFFELFFKNLLITTVRDALSFYVGAIAFVSAVRAKGSNNILDGTLKINTGNNLVAGII